MADVNSIIKPLQKIIKKLDYFCVCALNEIDEAEDAISNKQNIISKNESAIQRASVIRSNLNKLIGVSE